MVYSVCPRPQVFTGSDVIVAIVVDPSWLGSACGVDHLLKVAGPPFLAAAGPVPPGLRPAGPTFQHEGRASFGGGWLGEGEAGEDGAPWCKGARVQADCWQVECR